MCSIYNDLTSLVLYYYYASPLVTQLVTVIMAGDLISGKRNKKPAKYTAPVFGTFWGKPIIKRF